MTLRDILKGVDYKRCDMTDIEISGLAHNSKLVESGFVFFALSDGKTDGRAFVDDAISAGACAVVFERDGRDLPFDIINYSDVVFVEVNSVRFAMSVMARNFYGCVDEKMKIVGVVGSNGKTTTSTIVCNILRQNNLSVGLIGTNGVFYGDKCVDTNMTTPDPIELHKLLRNMYDSGVAIVVMEVSAHAIYYQKIAGIKFDIGIFTNISNEHLDFFGDMENYSQIKESFFMSSYVRECVVNIDDDLGMKIAYNTDIPCVSYGLTRPANIFALDIAIRLDEMSFVVNAMDDILRIKTALVGDYNVYNIMAAIGACKMLGVADRLIELALINMQNVGGRWQVYKMDDDKIVVVDFAHTPMSFEKVLSNIKALRRGKITTIFGCVGYSDSEKRKQMGKCADKYSDHIVLTSDNTCDSVFDDIVLDISRGITKQYEVMEDRTTAITQSFNKMIGGETLVILGKGNEKYQKIKGELVPYCDIDVITDLIKK